MVRAHEKDKEYIVTDRAELEKMIRDSVTDSLANYGFDVSQKFQTQQDVAYIRTLRMQHREDIDFLATRRKDFTETRTTLRNKIAEIILQGIVYLILFGFGVYVAGLK